MLDRRNMLGRERRRQGISKANALEAIAMTPPRPRITKPRLVWRLRGGVWTPCHRITWTEGTKRRDGGLLQITGEQAAFVKTGAKQARGKIIPHA